MWRDAAELLVDRRVHLAELGAEAGRAIKVLADGDLGSGLGRDVAEVVGVEVRAPSRPVGGVGAGSSRSPRSRRSARPSGKQASDLVRQEPEVSAP